MSTDWNHHYRTGDTPWDKGAPAPPLLEWLDAPGHRFDGEVLVPGCGFGHDVRAIAVTGHAAQVCGLDISPAALDQAMRWPSAGNGAYIEGDLFNLPPDFRTHFDWVFEHTCFCASTLPGARITCRQWRKHSARVEGSWRSFISIHGRPVNRHRRAAARLRRDPQRTGRPLQRGL